MNFISVLTFLLAVCFAIKASHTLGTSLGFTRESTGDLMLGVGLFVALFWCSLSFQLATYFGKKKSG
jgi:hypothetical protein